MSDFNKNMKEFITQRSVCTKHARKRLKSRLGLNKKSTNKHAVKVFRDGVVVCKTSNNNMRIRYNGYDYIFTWCYDDYRPVMVTTYLPKNNSK